MRLFNRRLTRPSLECQASFCFFSFPFSLTYFTMSLITSQQLDLIDEISNDINDFLITYNEMEQHSEDQHKSVKHHLSQLQIVT